MSTVSITNLYMGRNNCSFKRCFEGLPLAVTEGFVSVVFNL